MSGSPQKGSAFTPPRIRRSIKLDRVQARDFLNYPMIYCCEQCSFFDPIEESCTMGFPSEPHRQDNQLAQFNRTGHMAHCRFLEID